MARPANPRARDALLEAARAEFARAGLEGARIEDIARRAGVSKGAFYLHFSSKEEAFREILQRFLGVLEEQALRRREAELRFQREVGDPSAATLERTIDFDAALDAELLDVLWRNRLIVAALDRAAGQPYAGMVADFRRRMRHLVSGRIALKQEEGWLRGDVDAEVVSDVLLGTYEGYARRMFELRDRPDLAGGARSFLTVLYTGVLEARPAVRRTRRAAAARD